MRRKDREVTDREKIVEILDNAHILHLAMFDGEYPYNVPLHYGYEFVNGTLTLYMHCAREGHKLDCLRANPNVCFALDCDIELVPGSIACEYGSKYASVIGRGNASVIEDAEEKAAALKVFMKCQTGRDFEITAKMAEAVSVIKVEAKEYTAKCRAK